MISQPPNLEMGDQANHFLHGFGLSWCLRTEGAEPAAVAKCYNRYFSVCRKTCPQELDQLILDCGYDNRPSPC